MQDPLLADQRMQLARYKFQQAYKGETMLMDVERELVALEV